MTPITPAPAVETVGLTKRYGDLTVLDRLDLTVPRGSVFALLGPNGAGKTTTVRILATLVRPDAGLARVGGHDVTSQRRLVRRSISLTGQFAAVDEMQTGLENLRMAAALAGLGRSAARRRADELLDRFDLTTAGKRRVATYSGGMRRRLDIAAGLTGQPGVVFLDEPTTGLDPRSRRQVWDVVSEMGRSGVTVFLTTQYLEEAERLADRIAIMDGGRLVADGTADELKQRVAGSRLDLVTTDPVTFEKVRLRLRDRVCATEPARLLISVPSAGDAPSVRALLDEIDPDGTGVARFTVHGASLDDVFFALTGHPAHDEQNKETADV